MTLSGEIRKLTQNMLEGHESRTAAVAGIRTSTAQELAEFHAAHQAQAEEQRERLSEYRDGLRRDTATFLSDAAGARQAMATQQREQRDEYRDGLRRDTATFLSDAAGARQAMATQQREQRDEYRDGLRRGTAALLKELDVAREAMATEQRGRLATERERLTSDVAAMRDRFQAEQSKVQADLSKARRVWSSFTGQMQQRRGRVGRPVAAPPPPPPSVKEAPPTEEAEAAADDLTVIRGIGTAMQHRLNEAGFYTYAQLVKATPKELRQALGEAGPRVTRVNVEEWIERARELLE